MIQGYLLVQDPEKPLQHSTAKLHTYTGEPIKVLGSTEVLVQHNGQSMTLPLIVMKGKGSPLLGRNWLSVLKLDWQNVFTNRSLQDVLTCFGEVFIDLKSGYHHLDIYPEHQTYLGFQWEGKFYMFTVLPFGLSTACYIFTKLLRPVVKHIRALGVSLVLYLDDGIVSVKALEAQAVTVSEFVQDTLAKAGLVIN